MKISRLAMAVCLLIGSVSFAQTRPAGAPGDGSRRPFVQMRLKALHDAANSQSLSDDQKTKIDALFDKAMTEITAKMDEMDKDATPAQERMEQGRQMFDDLKEKVEGVLNEDQRKGFEKKQEELQQRMRQGGGEMFGHLRESISKLDLSADQKEKLEKVMKDAIEKAQAARKDAQGDPQKMRDAMQGAMRETIQQINAVLTPEQQEKLRAMRDNIDGGGPGAPRDRGSRRPATAPAADKAKANGEKMSDDKMMADEKMGDDKMSDKMMADGKMDADNKKPAKEKEGNARPAFSDSGPKVGEKAPDFELKKLDGRPVRLSFFNGRVLVLVFGSYSSPTFREKAAALDQIVGRHALAANYLLVYTKEAYPAGDREVSRNKEQSVSVAQTANESARMEQAKKAQAALKLSMPIAVDTQDDAVANAYGAMPNGAVIVGRDGTIVYRQKWLEPYSLGLALDDAVSREAARK